MDWSFRENWDELTWAREIRKDEVRIAGYFRTLPACLDLPGEDEMIFKRLMSQPEMVPTGVSDPVKMLRSEFEISSEEFEEEEEIRRENRRRNNFNVVRRVEKMAAEWNVSAARMPAEKCRDIIKVVCAFGKVLSRLYNFEDTEDSNDTLPLRRALLRYMISDVDELQNILDEFKAGGNDFPDVENFTNTIGFVRESILDLSKTLQDNQ